MQRQISMLIIACALCSIQCTDKGEEEKPQPTTQKLRGSWSPYYPNLFHDGEPFESANFIIYSDKSSPEWREEMAGIAEEYLSDIHEPI